MTSGHVTYANIMIIISIWYGTYAESSMTPQMTPARSDTARSGESVYAYAFKMSAFARVFIANISRLLLCGIHTYFMFYSDKP